jgi:hypothetical protein
MDKLIQIAATQLSDQLPESREAARNLALELQVFYEKSQASTSGENEGEPSASPDAESWEAFCQSKLSALSAQAILRVTSTTPKEGVTAGVTSAPKEGVASTRVGRCSEIEIFHPDHLFCCTSSQEFVDHRFECSGVDPQC